MAPTSGSREHCVEVSRAGAPALPDIAFVREMLAGPAQSRNSRQFEAIAQVPSSAAGLTVRRPRRSFRAQPFTSARRRVLVTLARAFRHKTNTARYSRPVCTNSVAASGLPALQRCRSSPAGKGREFACRVHAGRASQVSTNRTREADHPVPLAFLVRRWAQHRGDRISFSR